MNRRTFLLHSLGGVAVLSFAPLHSLAKTESKETKMPVIKSKSSILATGDGARSEYLNPGPFQEAIEAPAILFLWSEQKGEVRIPVPFVTHSVAQNPQQPQFIVLIPKWGRRAVEVDLLNGKITRSFHAAKGVRFFGHGFYSQDGKTVFLSETNDTESKSHLSLWEGSTSEAKQIQQIATHGDRVHECITTRDSKQIVACNTGWALRKHPSSIVWLDRKSYALDHQLFFDGEGPSHIYETTDGHFIYGGGFSVKGMMSKVSVCGSVGPDKKRHSLTLPEDQMKFFFGETLSLTANEKSKQAFVTTPSGNSVFVFDYTNGKFVQRLEVKSPSGIQISEDRSQVYVTSRIDNAILTFDTKTFKQLERVVVPELQGWGSHIVRLNSVAV